MEKHSMNVNAYRTETSFTTKGELVSTVELIVPAEEVQILREMHSLQEIRPVAYLLSVAHRETGEHRELNLHSKGSKMKDFVPVVILTKRAESSDDLNSLFDASAFELTLNVEVAKDEAPLYDEQPETVGDGVMNEKEVQALPSSEPIDAEFRVLTNGEDAPETAERMPTLTDEAEAFLGQCNRDQLNKLLKACGFLQMKSANPSEEILLAARTNLLKNWDRVITTAEFKYVKQELSSRSANLTNDDIFTGEDMPFTPEGGVA